MKFIEKAKKLIGKNKEVALISAFAAAALIALLIIGASGYTVDAGDYNDDTQIEFSDSWDYSDDDIMWDDDEDSSVVADAEKDKVKEADKAKETEKKAEDKKSTTTKSTTTAKKSTTTAKKSSTTATKKTSSSSTKKPSSSSSTKKPASSSTTPSTTPAEEKPSSEQPSTEPANPELKCTMTIKCETAVGKCEEKKDIIPENGIIYEEKTFTFKEGETAFDVLQRELKDKEIHMEFEETIGIAGKYIKGINNLYEFDCGELSGWMYKVNGEFPNISCSEYVLKNGDVIEWLYTCDLGKDIGAEKEVSGEK